MKRRATLRLFTGDTLPPPTQYEEGDMFYVRSTTELYVRSGGAWVLIGSSSSVSDGANVGAGTGLIFRDKTGTILNFRTLRNTDGSLTIQTVGDEVRININTSGANAPITNAVNLGGGTIEVFKQKVGNTLEFRTIESKSNNYHLIQQTGDLIEVKGLDNTGGGVPIIAGDTGNDIELKGVESSDGSVNVNDTGSTIDLTVNTAGAGLVSDGANVGTGVGLVFRDKTGSVLNFRSLKNVGLGSRVIAGTATDEVEFRAISGLFPIYDTEFYDTIYIHTYDQLALYPLTYFTFWFDPLWDWFTGNWWINLHRAGSDITIPDITLPGAALRGLLFLTSVRAPYRLNWHAFHLNIEPSNHQGVIAASYGATLNDYWSQEHLRMISMTHYMDYSVFSVVHSLPFTFRISISAFGQSSSNPGAFNGITRVYGVFE